MISDESGIMSFQFFVLIWTASNTANFTLRYQVYVKINVFFFLFLPMTHLHNAVKNWTKNIWLAHTHPLQPYPTLLSCNTSKIVQQYVHEEDQLIHIK